MAMIEKLEYNEVFVFGSNAKGQHGAGAARTAYEKLGAVWGEGHGRWGQTYAIDTMSGFDVLKAEVGKFLIEAEVCSELMFLLTPIGCGIAGYTPEQIAPLFHEASSNVVLPDEFKEVLNA